MKIEWKLWVNVAFYLISYFAAGDSLRSSTPTTFAQGEDTNTLEEIEVNLVLIQKNGDDEEKS